MDITKLSPEILREAIIGRPDDSVYFRFWDRLMRSEPKGQTVFWPGVDPGEPKGDIQVTQGWKVVSGKTVIRIDRERLEREIKFDGYRSNNDRKAHGLHTLRHRKIAICRKRNPELTLEARIGRKLRERVDQMTEYAFCYGQPAQLFYRPNLIGGVILNPKA